MITYGFRVVRIIFVNRKLPRRWIETLKSRFTTEPQLAIGVFFDVGILNCVLRIWLISGELAGCRIETPKASQGCGPEGTLVVDKKSHDRVFALVREGATTTKIWFGLSGGGIQPLKSLPKSTCYECA